MNAGIFVAGSIVLPSSRWVINDSVAVSSGADVRLLNFMAGLRPGLALATGDVLTFSLGLSWEHAAPPTADVKASIDARAAYASKATGIGSTLLAWHNDTGSERYAVLVMQGQYSYTSAGRWVGSSRSHCASHTSWPPNADPEDLYGGRTYATTHGGVGGPYTDLGFFVRNDSDQNLTAYLRGCYDISRG